MCDSVRVPATTDPKGHTMPVALPIAPQRLADPCDDDQLVVVTILAGDTVTGVPAEQRVVGEYRANQYGSALELARSLRTSTYRHKQTGEVRELDENQTTGCAYADDQSVWHWVSRAEHVAMVGYAIVVERSSLEHYTSR